MPGQINLVTFFPQITHQSFTQVGIIFGDENLERWFIVGHEWVKAPIASEATRTV